MTPVKMCCAICRTNVVCIWHLLESGNTVAELAFLMGARGARKIISKCKYPKHYAEVDFLLFFYHFFFWFLVNYLRNMKIWKCICVERKYLWKFTCVRRKYLWKLGICCNSIAQHFKMEQVFFYSFQDNIAAHD